MSLHENMMDRPQAKQSVHTDMKLTRRLYPSLPNKDRYDVKMLEPSTGEKLQEAAQFHPEVLLEETQSEESAANSDIRTKAQLLILEEQRQELLSINERWAKEYRTMTQYYKEKVRDLQASLQQNHFGDRICEEEEMQIALCKKLQLSTLKDEKQIQTGDTNSKLLKAEEEVKVLRSKTHALTRTGQRQQEEVKRLNKVLEEIVLTAEPLGCSETLQDLWKHQAEVYKEDFLKERKDREKLMEKYLELEKRFRKVHTELCDHKSQETCSHYRPLQAVPECTCTNQAKCSYQEVRPVNHHQLQRRCTAHNKL